MEFLQQACGDLARSRTPIESSLVNHVRTTLRHRLKVSAFNRAPTYKVPQMDQAEPKKVHYTRREREREIPQQVLTITPSQQQDSSRLQVHI